MAKIRKIWLTIVAILWTVYVCVYVYTAFWIGVPDGVVAVAVSYIALGVSIIVALLAWWEVWKGDTSYGDEKA